MQVEIKGQTYSVGKLDVFQQFHVARRLAPLLYATSSALLARLRDTGAAQSTDELTSMVEAAEPMVQVISSMSDADSQYVINGCLSVCQRRTGTGQGAGFQRILVDGQRMMFDDIDLVVMMQLVVAAIRMNLGNFLDALPEQSADAKRPA